MQEHRPPSERGRAGLPAFEPGQWVRHPTHAEWGLGQVQSAIGDRITINFEHAGKVMVNAGRIDLMIEDPS